jgi:hypothetical protein
MNALHLGFDRMSVSFRQEPFVAPKRQLVSTNRQTADLWRSQMDAA